MILTVAGLFIGSKIKKKETPIRINRGLLFLSIRGESRVGNGLLMHSCPFHYLVDFDFIEKSK
jgi:hypothetical protein